MSKTDDIKGIIVPLVTPFDKSGKLDEGLFRAQVRYLLSCGVHGLSPGGSTGEGAMVRDEELVRMIEIIREEDTRGIKVVAGIIRCSTRDAVNAGLAAKKAGADALMVTPVFYNVLVPDEEGNYSYFKTISDEIGLPIVIYNVVPQNPVSVNTFLKLLEIDNVIGIKQSIGGIMEMYAMKRACGDKGLVFAATDEMLFSCFELGADGAISAILSIFPRIAVKMWNLCHAGRYEEGIMLQNKLYPVWKAIGGPQFTAKMKAVLRALGRDCGYPLSPMREYDMGFIADIKVQLDELIEEEKPNC